VAVADETGSSAADAGRAAGERIARLRQLRRRRPWTQRELAAVAGVSVGTVRCIEQGVYRTIQPRVVRALAGALGVEPATVAEFRVTLGLPPIGPIGPGARPEPDSAGGGAVTPPSAGG
jgi:transcriptional regulator with XRE-family HTH domain